MAEDRTWVGQWLGEVGQNFKDLGTAELSVGNILESVDDLKDWTAHWSITEKNITSSYQNVDDLKNELSNLQNGILSTEQFTLSPLDSVLKEGKTQLCSVVKVLDMMAGNGDATASDQLLSSVMNLCNALTACIAPVTAIGFPEIPLLGNIGELLKMLIQKDKIYSMLPEEIRKQVKEKIAAEKKGKSMSQYTSECIEKIKATGYGPLLESAKNDVIKILANLPFLPITILFSAISVLIDAVSQLFNVVGLGTFNFDSLIKGKGLNFNLNVMDPGFSFDPPGNILEALAKCIPLITNTIVTLPQMLINGVIENVYLISNGLLSLTSGALWTSNEAMVSAIQDTILSSELYGQNENYKSQIVDIEREISSKKSLIDELNEKIENPLMGFGMTFVENSRKEIEDLENEIKSLEYKKEELEAKIEENIQKISTLTEYIPDKGIYDLKDVNLYGNQTESVMS